MKNSDAFHSLTHTHTHRDKHSRTNMPYISQHLLNYIIIAILLFSQIFVVLFFSSLRHSLTHEYGIGRATRANTISLYRCHTNDRRDESSRSIRIHIKVIFSLRQRFSRFFFPPSLRKPYVFKKLIMPKFSE